MKPVTIRSETRERRLQTVRGHRSPAQRRSHPCRYGRSPEVPPGPAATFDHRPYAQSTTVASLTAAPKDVSRSMSCPKHFLTYRGASRCPVLRATDEPRGAADESLHALRCADRRCARRHLERLVPPRSEWPGTTVRTPEPARRAYDRTEPTRPSAVGTPPGTAVSFSTSRIPPPRNRIRCPRNRGNFSRRAHLRRQGRGAASRRSA